MTIEKFLSSILPIPSLMEIVVSVVIRYQIHLFQNQCCYNYVVWFVGCSIILSESLIMIHNSCHLPQGSIIIHSKSQFEITVPNECVCVKFGSWRRVFRWSCMASGPWIKCWRLAAGWEKPRCVWLSAKDSTVVQALLNLYQDVNSMWTSIARLVQK